VEDGRPLVWWANSDDPYWTTSTTPT